MNKIVILDKLNVKMSFVIKLSIKKIIKTIKIFVHINYYNVSIVKKIFYYVIWIIIIKIVKKNHKHVLVVNKK